MQERARHDEAKHQHAELSKALGPEEVSHVLFGKEVPTDDRRKGKEEQTNGDEPKAHGLRAQTDCKGFLREGDTGCCSIQEVS